LLNISPCTITNQRGGFLIACSERLPVYRRRDGVVAERSGANKKAGGAKQEQERRQPEKLLAYIVDL